MKPNLFIVGAAKAGTTSLYNYLNQHPDIYMSPIKEPHYFSKDFKPEKFRKDYAESVALDLSHYFGQKPLKERHIAHIQKLDDYLKLFDERLNQKILGETSTGYLYSKVAAKEIFQFNPTAKIIIVLREPIERTLSHFFMDYSVGRQKKDDDIFNIIKKDYESDKKGWGITNLYIDLSMYYEQVSRYLKVFPRNQVLILDFADFKQNPKGILKCIFNFLDINDNYKINIDVIHNKTFIPRNLFIRKIFRFKYIIPNKLRSSLMKYKKYLSKSKYEYFISDTLKDYIKLNVDEDWLRTKMLINRK